MLDVWSWMINDNQKSRDNTKKTIWWQYKMKKNEIT